MNEIETKCKKVEKTIKISALLKSKKNVFKMIRIYCNKFRAKIHYFLEEYASSLDCIRKAFEKMYEKNSTKSNQANDYCRQITKQSDDLSVNKCASEVSTKESSFSQTLV